MARTLSRGGLCAADSIISIDGQSRSAKEWADLHGLGWQALKMRRYRGMSWEDAFKPLRPGPKPRDQVAA